MDKALIILSDNNKGKFISKGFSSAFKELSYFVYEKKVYDLNLSEIESIKPNIIFIFWTDMTQKESLIEFFDICKINDTDIIHCAELISDIPSRYLNIKNNYIFTQDSKKKAYRYVPCVNMKQYRQKFNGYKYNITFSGNPSYIEREKILSSLVYNFGRINIFCRSYDFYKSVDDIQKSGFLNDKYIELYKESYKGYVEKTEELSEIYSSSKINIDLKNINEKFMNYRCLEILSSGGFLIAPYNKRIIKYLENGIEFETYNSEYDLIDKINFYLKNLNIANLISEKGRKSAASNFSYYDRLKNMLKVIYGKDTCNR